MSTLFQLLSTNTEVWTGALLASKFDAVGTSEVSGLDYLLDFLSGDQSVHSLSESPMNVCNDVMYVTLCELRHLCHLY